MRLGGIAPFLMELHMIKRNFFVAAALCSGAVLAAAETGQAAPAFSVKDLNGKDLNLAQFKGKTVVVEWNNPNCPFVKKHYVSSNMQGLQKETDSDAVWISVNSTNAKHQDYMEPKALTAWLAEGKSVPDHYVVDANGAMGKAFGAKTTPHMFIIDPTGKVVYNGAIDDKRSTNPEDVKTSKNFVRTAFADMKAGKQIANASNAPYGCSVKYSE
jgi:peroxiredoxin